MKQHLSKTLTLVTTLIVANALVAGPADTLQVRSEQAHAQLNGAEQRFLPPSEKWFYDTQAALREEVERVGQALDIAGPEYALGWKSHLHWHLLESNLHSMHVDLGELELVRRWLFSNRKGLEAPFFAELRRKIDLHLDAAFAFSHDDLEATFVEKVTLARQQCLALAQNGSDVNAVALGRTLSWFDRTGQLPEETQKIRSLLSLPNAQIVFSVDLVQRVLKLFDTEVDQTIEIGDTVKAPPSGLLQRQRTLQVSGSADTIGSTQLVLVSNEKQAQLNLVFHGQVDAHCRADAGPAALHVRTSGPVDAVKPIYLSGSGLQVGETAVDSQVKTSLRGITAGNVLIRRLAEGRANEPAARAHMRTSALKRTSELLQENMDERVDTAVAEIRAEISRARESIEKFQDIAAPIVREGALPRLQGIHSTLDSIEINISGERRNQFGAVAPCVDDEVNGDIQARVHISFLNNMLETILGGKRLSDDFLMRYAKILQAELPYPLMVHSRAQRWAITTRKERPLELCNPEPNQLEFVMRLTALEIAGETFAIPATATINYQLLENEFGEHELVRVGQIDLETALAPQQRSFLQKKLEAFFAPLLNAGGIAIPDGGMMSAVNDIKLTGVQFAHDWIVVGVNIPTEVIEQIVRYQHRHGVAADTQ